MTAEQHHGRRWLLRGARIALVLAVVAVGIYWLRLSPREVLERQVERGEIVAEVLGTGTLEARVQATISPKISGRIAEVLFDQGDEVRGGAVLVRLDDEELAQQVAIARANVDAAQAALKRLGADTDRAKAVAAQATTHHARVATLVERNAASQEELDKAVEALAIADAGLSRAEAAIIEGQKALVAAENTLEYHRARLADTRIVAPFDGLVVKRRREPGDVVVPGSAILTLIDKSVLWISAWVDETEMAHLAADQPARVVFRSEPQRAYDGRVARLGKEADRETREFLVDVQVLELPHNWAVGQRAEVYVEVARKADAVLLPAEMLVQRDAVSGTFVNQDGRAAWRTVELGLRSRSSVEVTAGLEPGESVVAPVDPAGTLRDGQPVSGR